jgi:CheY-like chemotaxis protein
MPTLLITDDHPSVLGALEFVLAGDTLRVLLADSGTAALAHVERGPVDAALVDLHMPAMDGLTLTRALKAHAVRTGHPLPVWIMTAAHTAATVEQGRLAGAEAVLKKPFDIESFAAELQRTLAGFVTAVF